MPTKRVILNAHFPGAPIGYKRVEWHGPRARKPELMAKTQERLRTMLKEIAPGLAPSSARFGVQQVFHLAPLCSQFHEPDGDNLEKLLWDAFNGQIWNDDSQIEEWQGRKVLNSADPHTHLVAYLIEK
jgi:Holliday junction resolvase RusA-like endonuclease